jgi:hypothetical protein
MNNHLFLHDAANILEMYGHILRKLKLKAEKYDDPELHRLHEILSNHRSKTQYFLDKVFKSLSGGGSYGDKNLK